MRFGWIMAVAIALFIATSAYPGETTAPTGVMDAFNKLHPGWKVTEVEKLTVDGRTAYELEAKTSGGEMAFVFFEDGTLYETIDCIKF